MVVVVISATAMPAPFVEFTDETDRKFKLPAASTYYTLPQPLSKRCPGLALTIPARRSSVTALMNGTWNERPARP